MALRLAPPVLIKPMFKLEQDFNIEGQRQCLLLHSLTFFPLLWSIKSACSVACQLWRPASYGASAKVSALVGCCPSDLAE
jgi:hypothetical protein